MAPKRSSLTQTTLDASLAPRASSTLASDATHRISKKPPPAKLKARPKATAAAATDRVLTDVLIAIKPVHLANVVSREKNHEYRKYRLRDGVTRLWLYETGDGGKGRASITHIAVIPATVRHTPGTVPTEPFGIGNDDFNAGLKQSKYGYPVLELHELVCPVTLAEMKDRWQMGGAPMGWRYVEAHLWEDRWGEDEARADKVRRVF
ncbi:hypothetical protein HRG_001707 [Hirsutella rhossiliensis]|uniref:PUA-like domain protein n=1 Tax=Hirsutella rhossiliensis TaxID=111463 RepID=A0A9P8N274_9HYPO|nr:uncharacterized protein HRG_01707 [Hirsutella rhossiliensis]KAH0966298.1 hypothetical protein HRG_01707 [Hirsutella rhossiliensis]